MIVNVGYNLYNKNKNKIIIIIIKEYLILIKIKAHLYPWTVAPTIWDRIIEQKHRRLS